MDLSMPASCLLHRTRASAFVAPSLTGLSWFTSEIRCTPLRKCRQPFLCHSRSSRLCMNAISPDDIPSDAPDPADKHIDMELLRQRMSDVNRKARGDLRSSDSVIDLSAISESMAVEEVEEDEFLDQFANIGSLWVIIFTSAADGSDGVYSLSVAEENIVLAFEEREEAKRYALSLEAQEFPSPQVCELDAEELQSFCGEAGFRLGFVPRGSLITPPDESAIDDLDKWRGKPSSSRATPDSTGLSDDDIEIMKKRLDKLFGI